MSRARPGAPKGVDLAGDAIVSAAGGCYIGSNPTRSLKTRVALKQLSANKIGRVVMGFDPELCLR
jgi:hypothetical protein